MAGNDKHIIIRTVLVAVYEKAIELGYVKLSQEISEQYTEENPYDEE